MSLFFNTEEQADRVAQSVLPMSRSVHPPHAPNCYSRSEK